jgi:hypothetical protein
MVNKYTGRGVSRCLHQRRRLKIFNFFCSSAAAFKNSQVIGGGALKILNFFELSAVAAGFFSKKSAAAAAAWAAKPHGLHLYIQADREFQALSESMITF